MDRSDSRGDALPVVVVGAGVSGLAAAWAVRRAGWPVVVLESGDRVGGVVETLEIDGYRLETGPASAMADAALGRLLADAGLDGERVGPRPGAARRYVARDGRPVAVPNGLLAALATPLLSPRAKMRALGEPVVPRAPVDAAEETLAAFVRRRFGAEVLDALIDAVACGVYAGDPERLSARHALPTLSALERRFGSVLVGAVRGPRTRRAMISFGGGLRRLPESLGASLGNALRLRTRLTALRPAGAGWTVDAERGGRAERRRAAAVVLATPAHALAHVNAGPALGPALASIARTPHAPVATVALGFRRGDVAHPLDGFGVLVPARERCDVLGVLFASSVFADRAPSGRVLVTCFVGGARRPELALEPAELVERRALAAVSRLLGVRGRPTLVHTTRWSPGIPQYEVGHGAVLDAAARAETELPGLLFAGSWRDGVSIGDCVACGLEAGRRAVERLETRPRAAGGYRPPMTGGTIA